MQYILQALYKFYGCVTCQYCYNRQSITYRMLIQCMVMHM